MATIMVEGPLVRVREAIARQVGRVGAAVAGLVMLSPVFHIEPGVARQICALSAGVLFVGAAWPRRHAHPDNPATMRDLVELEKAILRTREDAEVAMLRTRQEIDQRASAFGDRLDGITDLVAEIADQVR